MLFLQNDSHKQAIESFCELAHGCSLKVIAWRTLKTNSECIGNEAKKTEPCIRQVNFIFL